MTKEEVKTLVNDFDKIGLQIMYGYYGGDLSETNTDKMQEYVTNSIFASKEDSALILTVKALESKYAGEDGSYDNSWKLMGVFLNKDNFNLFCDIKGGKDCEFLCKLNKSTDKINNFINGYNTITTFIDDASEIYDSAKTLMDNNSSKQEYSDALVDSLKSTLDFSSDLFGTLFGEYDKCLSILNNVCQYTIDSFIDISKIEINKIRMSEIISHLETYHSGEFKLIGINNLINMTFENEKESDYKDSNSFMKHINDTYLSYNDLQKLYESGIFSDDEYLTIFGDYINWYMNQSFYSIFGGKDKFDDFMDKIGELDSSNSFFSWQTVERGIEWWNKYIADPTVDFWDENVAEPGSEIIEDIVDRYNNKEDIFSTPNNILA